MKVNGAGVSSLREAHDWCKAHTPDEVTIDLEWDTVAAGVSWRYAAPLGVKIMCGTLEPGAGEWALVYVPYNGGPLKMERVTVRCGPQGGVSVAAADKDGNGNSSGETQFAYGARFTRNVWVPAKKGHGPALAGLYLQGVRDFRVDDDDFRNLQVQGPDGKNVHGVYATDRSKGYVTMSVFNAISGDPIRARDGSILVVSNCESIQSGVNGLSSVWLKRGEDESRITVKNNCRASKTFAGKPAALFTKVGSL